MKKINKRTLGIILLVVVLAVYLITTRNNSQDNEVDNNDNYISYEDPANTELSLIEQTEEVEETSDTEEPYEDASEDEEYEVAYSDDEEISTEEVSEEIEEVQTEKEEELPKPKKSDYKFRNATYLKQHYDKHGKEMGFEDAESYLAAANAVIHDPNTLHKLEAEDGDDVYYLEATEEFVVVSKDGYIRTYYYASKAYFDRQ